MSNRNTEWICSSCSYSNYSSRSNCFKCGTVYISSVPSLLAPKSHPIDMKKNAKSNLSTSLSLQQPNILGSKMNGTIRAGLSTKILPGDWICNLCQLNNFAARVKCIQCGASHAGALRPVDRAGDWSCPNDNCRFHNFASRKECHRCGTRKLLDKKLPCSLPSGSFMSSTTCHNSNPKTSSLKAGDWICQRKDCGAHNFAKRDSCFQCGHSPLALDETTNRISVFGFSTTTAVSKETSDSPVNVYLDYGQSFFSSNPFSPYGFGQHQS